MKDTFCPTCCNSHPLKLYVTDLWINVMFTQSNPCYAKDTCPAIVAPKILPDTGILHTFPPVFCDISDM